MTASPTPQFRYRRATGDDRDILRAMYILTDQWGDESRPVSEGIDEELAAYVDAWTPQQPGVILERVPGDDSAEDSRSGLCCGLWRRPHRSGCRVAAYLHL